MVHLITDEGSAVTKGDKAYEHNGQLVRDLKFYMAGEYHVLTVPLGVLYRDFEALKERVR